MYRHQWWSASYPIPFPLRTKTSNTTRCRRRLKLHPLRVGQGSNKTSEIPSENNASFLETMAKGIFNQSQGTTFIAEEQTHIGRESGSRKGCPDTWWNTAKSVETRSHHSTASGEGWVGVFGHSETCKGKHNLDTYREALPYCSVRKGVYPTRL